jgi:hypothetical protein
LRRLGFNPEELYVFTTTRGDLCDVCLKIVREGHELGLRVGAAHLGADVLHQQWLRVGQAWNDGRITEAELEPFYRRSSLVVQGQRLIAALQAEGLYPPPERQANTIH